MKTQMIQAGKTGALVLGALSLSLCAWATSVPMQEAQSKVRCTGPVSAFVATYAGSSAKAVPEAVKLVFGKNAKTKRELKSVLRPFAVQKVNKSGKTVSRIVEPNFVEAYLDTQDPRVVAKDMLIYRDTDKKLEWTTSYFTIDTAAKHEPNMLSIGDDIVAKYCKKAS